YRGGKMMLWTDATIGSPGSIPSSARIDISVSPNLSKSSWDSQTSKTWRLSASPKHTWTVRAAGVRAPASSSAASTASYCAALKDGGLKYIAMAIGETSVVGSAARDVDAVPGCGGE